jgi:hypothetical protein
VRRSGVGADAYRLALRQAEAAVRREPQNLDYQITLGAALYRADRAAEAVKVLDAVVARQPEQPAALAFLAMAQKQLGLKECQDTLKRLHEVMTQPSAYRSLEALRLHAEARSVILGLERCTLSPQVWQVVGPFAGGGEDGGLAKEFPPEKGVDVKAVYPGKFGEVAWKVALPRNEEVDLLAAFGYAEQIVSYAYCELESPADQEAGVLLYTANRCRLWINGGVVHTVDQPRSAVTSDYVRISLRKGRNTVLLKIANPFGAQGFLCFFDSPQPLRGPR